MDSSVSASCFIREWNLAKALVQDNCCKTSMSSSLNGRGFFRNPWRRFDWNCLVENGLIGFVPPPSSFSPLRKELFRHSFSSWKESIDGYILDIKTFSMPKEWRKSSSLERFDRVSSEVSSMSSYRYCLKLKGQVLFFAHPLYVAFRWGLVARLGEQRKNQTEEN